MSKSYWMREQKGNFSKEGKDTFDPWKRYVGIRLQQGVPLLDRDWNELEDIRRYEELMLRKWYVGNGTPDDGFRILAAPAKNDFKIKAGRCLVDGFEVVNDNEISYEGQKGVRLLSPETNREDTVYLDVWIEEVTHKEDPALANPQDVNVETCIRHKLEWRVKVDEGSVGYNKEGDHHYYDIARIKREAGRDTILDTDIEDLRRTGLAVYLFKEQIESLNKEIESLKETKLSAIRVVEDEIDVPANGEVEVFLERGNKHAFYLISLHTLPLFPHRCPGVLHYIHWKQEGRVVGTSVGTSFYENYLVIQNSSPQSKERIRVSYKVYRIAET